MAYSKEREFHQQDIIYNPEIDKPMIPAGTHGPTPHLLKIAQVGKKDNMGQRVYDTKGIATSQRAEGGGQGAKTGLYAIPIALRNRGKGKLPEYNKTNKANALTRVQTDSMVQQGLKIRRLTPLECERVMGFPDNWTEGLSDTQRYKCLGNAVVPQVIKAIYENLEMPKR